MVLRAAKSRNLEVVVAAIKEEAFPEIEAEGFPVHWLGVGQLGKLVRVFKAAGVSRAIMAGQVRHVQVFGSSLPDLTMIRMLAGLKQKNTDSLIAGVAQVLAENEITLVNSTELLQPFLAPAATLTRRGLDRREEADVEYGRPIAMKIAGMDIGQTVVVREKAVVAVEAMEGTDDAVRRAGRLVNNRNLTVIKVGKPHQDMRFDVPVVGLPTIETMIETGATALVLDARRTLMFDREEMISLADRHGIAIVGLTPLEPQQSDADEPGAGFGG